PRAPPLESGLAADQLRSRKAVLELANQLRRIVAERDRADTALASGDQDRTQRTLANRKADRRVGPTGAEAPRGHTEHRVRLFVEAPAGVVSGVVDRGRG